MIKKTVIAIILVLLIGIVVLYGCTKDKESEDMGVQKTTSQIIDCGTSKTMLADDISKVNLEGDAALKCLGNNLLNNCKNSKAILETSDAGKMIFEIKGLQNFNCIVRYQYGDASQITSVLHKDYANTYIECPLNINELKSSDSSEKPADFALGIWSYLGMAAMDSQANCYGTLKDKMNP